MTREDGLAFIGMLAMVAVMAAGSRCVTDESGHRVLDPRVAAVGRAVLPFATGTGCAFAMADCAKRGRSAAECAAWGRTCESGGMLVAGVLDAVSPTPSSSDSSRLAPTGALPSAISRIVYCRVNEADDEVGDGEVYEVTSAAALRCWETPDALVAASWMPDVPRAWEPFSRDDGDGVDLPIPVAGAREGTVELRHLRTCSDAQRQCASAATPARTCAQLRAALCESEAGAEGEGESEASSP